MKKGTRMRVKFPRETQTHSDARAGCWVCSSDGTARWFGKNAQGVAARHTDATGHHTWVEALLFISYTSGETSAEGAGKE